MTKSEWVEVLAAQQALWPATPMPSEDAVAISYSLVGDIDKNEALRVLQQLAVDGEQFPPPPGVIVSKARPAALRRTPADGWLLIKDAVGRVGCSPYAVDFSERHQAAVDWLAEQDVVLAAYAARRGLVGEGALGREPDGDPEFGGAVRHRLQGDIADAYQAADARVAQGLPAVEPRQLQVRNTAAGQGGMADLLGRLRPADQIESGDDD